MGEQDGRPSRINICTTLYVLGVDFRRWRTERCEFHRPCSHELSAANSILYTELICSCKRGLRIDGSISLITRKCCRCSPLIRSQMFHSSWFSRWPFLSLFLRSSSRISTGAGSTNGRSCARSRCLFAATLADSNRGLLRSRPKSATAAKPYLNRVKRTGYTTHLG